MPSNGGDNSQLPPLAPLDISSISLALLVLGGYVCLIGQLSFWLKERLFLSSALISVCVGIAVGPIGLNWVSPWVWTSYNDDTRNSITYEFTRLVIGIQVMFAGISLPAAYLRKEMVSLAVLLIPIMTIAWFVSSGLILALVPGLTFLEALCIGACVTPTDPILANAIVKGRYAEKHVPENVRNLISAESGANDGLGYPFILLPILIMRRGDQTVNAALREWVISTWLYQIALACAIGALIGFVARKTLKEAHKRQLIDHESFLAYGVGLAFLVLGIVGVLGSDDLLAAFIAGNSLTWKDFYRIESEDDTFQDVIDGLLNASIFIYIGCLLPWSEFGLFGLTPWRLVVLAMSILLVRRLPWIMLIYAFVPAIETRKQALFTGWFGPVGVSAVYYAMLALRELPDERVHLREVIVPVVLFLAFASTVAHGVTIPLTHHAPKALVQTKSTMSVASMTANDVFRRLRRQPVTAADISSPIRSTALSNSHGSSSLSRSGSRSRGRTVSDDLHVASTPPSVPSDDIISSLETGTGVSLVQMPKPEDIHSALNQSFLRTGRFPERSGTETPSRVEFDLPEVR